MSVADDDGARPVSSWPRADSHGPRRQYGADADVGFRYFHSYESPLPEFPAFTHINEAVTTADHVLHQHRHPTYEIVYVHAGRCRWTVDGAAFDLAAGDLWITRPGEPHGGRPDPKDPQHNFAVGFDPALLPLAGRLGGARADDGARDVSVAVAEARAFDAEPILGTRVIHGAHGIEAIYRRILGELDRAWVETSAPDRALTVIMVQALLVELLVSVTRLHAAQRAAASPAQRAPARPEFQRLIAWLPTRLADPPALAEMAQRVGLSPAHFATVFRGETGQTALEYMTALRIDEAARRLAARRDVPVTDIALDLGFSSSQYFAIVFKKLKGRTPSEWQRLHAPG
ncbi:MAG TPA: AraC family transcriptional regulator [Planctomycetota bacterium]|nr:AraC family transcriptional regulator [Planctomycetota bacterium]